MYVNILRSSQNVNFSDKYRNVYISDKKIHRLCYRGNIT